MNYRYQSDQSSQRPQLRFSVNLIFPMAGQGARFGFQFKPFLRIGGEAFIEAAVRPFRQWMPVIRRVFFVFLEEQEHLFDVDSCLAEMFSGIDYKTVHLVQPTRGPAETLLMAAEKEQLSGPVLVCDCDHSVDVTPLMDAILQGKYSDQCVLPVWDISREDLTAWSIVTLSDDQIVTGIAEKKVPVSFGELAGVIGCYYFADISAVAEACRLNDYTNLSEVIAQFIKDGNRVSAVTIKNAEFFGDPKRLNLTLKQRD